MELKGLTGGLYQPLSPADIKTIHQAALAILEKTGISYRRNYNLPVNQPQRTDLIRRNPRHGKS